MSSIEIEGAVGGVECRTDTVVVGGAGDGDKLPGGGATGRDTDWESDGRHVALLYGWSSVDSSSDSSISTSLSYGSEEWDFNNGGHQGNIVTSGPLQSIL